MTSLQILGGVIFIRDDEDSDKWYEVFRAEHNCKNYRLKIDRTTPIPYYELYRDWRENKRNFADRLYASGSLDKIDEWIKQNLL